ncbi:MAG: hypothetical protein KAI99_20490, partial [Cyclobacteriaceae bacterium]|nr:hypothetical protein [Cyclobacteriaceae bacterium]
MGFYNSKTTATIHEIPSGFLDGLWGQFDKPIITSDGLIGDFDTISPGKIKLAQPLQFKNGGFALEFWIEIDEFKNDIILEGIETEAKKIELNLTKNATLEFTMTNGMDFTKLVSDKNRLLKGKKHHIA